MNRIAIGLGAAGLALGFAAGAMALSDLPFDTREYADVYAQDDIYELGDIDNRCGGGVDSRTGRVIAEIKRCGTFEGVSDEQVIIAQRSRANTMRGFAARKCIKEGQESVPCRLAKHQTAAIRHTALVQIAVFTGQDGDGTVQLAASGEVQLIVSGTSFSTPETVLLAEMRAESGSQLGSAAQ